MIGNSINELISIAERQSDERLAQELNPQTETGMLGPAWLPASELAFRQKIRAEAQAQPQTNPPVVQQLAQASMPPMMPQQPMAQQGMPQQMPPQQMMPQQPMPPQMMAHGGMVDGATQSEKDALLSIWDKMTPEQKEQMMNKSSESDRERKFWDAYEADPDSFAKDAQYYDILQKDRQSAGDLIGYANGGHVNVGQRLGPLISPDDLLRRTFPQLYPVPVSPDQQIVDSAIDQLMANQPNIADQANKNAQENEMLRNRLARMEEESEQYNQSSPATISPPLTVMGKDQVGGGISGIDPDDIPNAGNLDIDAEGNIIKPNENNYPDLEETLTERAKARGAILPGIISGVKDIGQKTVKGYLDLVGPEILASEGLDPNLYDPDWVDLVSPDDKKPTEIQDDKEPTEAQVLEEIQVTAQKRGPLVDSNANKENVAVTGDGTPIVNKPSDLDQSGGSKGVTDDALLAEQQRLDELKEQIFKGNMDRKWMAIAAGAFNAAQKGAPTLMQGLADLGGGVTQELQKMDKEDQDRAMALYEIYLQEATLAESKRKTDLTYASDMADVMSKLNQAGVDNKMEQLKYLLESGTDYADIAKSVTQGMIGEDYLHSADILHSKIGNPNARISYNQHLSKLRNKEAEIISKIEEEIGEDYDPKNSEHKERATALYDEFLNDNPGLREIRSDYWSGTNQSDWVTGTLIL